MQKFKLFINNERVDALSGKTYEVLNPAKNEPIAEVALADAKDVDRAVRAAKEAFDSGVWSELEGDERAEYMLKAAQLMKKRSKELARWETLQSGKPITESEDVDLPYSVRAMEYFANQAREIKGEVIPIPGKYAFDYVTYEPYGVVGSIVPWNFPLHLATRTLCPAIATGNTVVLKPSSLTPITAILLGEILLEVGFPPGVVNVVSGPGETAGSAILSHPDINMISFTGSLEVGRKVLEASARPRIKKVVLELGGKGPFIAEPDCNVGPAVNSLIEGFCLNQGEVCCASTRLFLHEDIYQEFMDELANKVNSLRIGDTLDQATQMGSLISKGQLEKVDSHVKEAVKSGANLVCGGKRFTDPPCQAGNYYQPTILDNVTNDMRCAQEEIFGPVLVVIEYRELEEAIKQANDSNFGLSATIWTENSKTLYWAARKLNAGTVWMNTNIKSKIEAPYGGNKDSGLGRENGTAGLKEYLKIKNNILFVGEKYDNFYGFE